VTGGSIRFVAAAIIPRVRGRPGQLISTMAAVVQPV
jgi:hypothetical protein